MKSTGILRRIDELGRIVIPKEIRRHLRIRDGESLEIFIENDNIILKKHSMIGAIEDIAKLCVTSFNEVIDANVIITDRDKVIATSPSLKRKYMGKEITDAILSMILNRSPIHMKEKVTIKITEEEENCRYIAVPIIADGDPIGLILVLSFDNELDVINEKIASFIAKFLSMHIE